MNTNSDSSSATSDHDANVSASADANTRDAREVHSLYEDQPYPARNRLAKHDGAPLPPLEWINAMARPGQPVLGPGKRLLVAGCGTGPEAFRYAMVSPKSSVVGVDFSARSIEIAQQLAAEEGYENLTLEVADLTQDSLAETHEPFDFISLHGVIDYIPDAAAAFASLARVLKPDGCLYLGANGPGHPNVLYKRALESFGLQIGQREFSEEDREKLQAIEVMMGADCEESVADATETYLATDIFAAQNHSCPMQKWLSLASGAGLHLLTSLDLPALVPPSDPRVLRHFLPHDRPTLSRIAGKVQHKSFMRLLFLKEPRREPRWTELEDFAKWRPTMLKSAREQLPRLQGNWQQLQRTLISIPGLGRQRIYLSPAACDYLRRCEGAQTAIEVWASLPEPAGWETLVLPLFSCYQAGVLYWTLP